MSPSPQLLCVLLVALPTGATSFAAFHPWSGSGGSHLLEASTGLTRAMQAALPDRLELAGSGGT